MGDARLNSEAGEVLLQGGRPERRRGRDALLIIFVSALLLVPCFWQSRIQGGDLSSHLYNAWLATLISQGKAPGLWIEHRSNNVLSDLALQWLLQHGGSGVAQRVLVPATVLIFSWGAIAFMAAVAGRRNWWFSQPWAWMLAYGFCYEIGFFNFYLSFGLCLWYLAIFWRSRWWMGLAASPLLVLAWTAHPFPVVWAVGTAGYVTVARNRPPRQRLIALGLGVAAVWAARLVLMSRFECRWSWWQMLFVSGADQLLIFGLKYLCIIAPLLLVSVLLVIRLIKTQGWGELTLSIPFQLWVLSAAAVVLIPNDVFFRTYAVAFGYIANRLSLPAGILGCALLAQVPLRKYEKMAMVLIVAAFSAMLYADTREFNRWEDSVDAKIAQLPPGQRVVSSLPALTVPVDPLWHMVDRACVGRCYSYANYEPSTRQFRIRAEEGNGIVLSRFADAFAFERTEYVVKPGDLPLYLLYACHTTQWEACVRSLSAGEVVRRGEESAPAKVSVQPVPNTPPIDPQWDNPARRSLAAGSVHQTFGGDAYGTVDEKHEGGPVLIVHNKQATKEWADKFFAEGKNSPTNELMWKLGFRSYVVTNGTEAWQMNIDEDPKYRPMFKEPPPPLNR